MRYASLCMAVCFFSLLFFLFFFLNISWHNDIGFIEVKKKPTTTNPIRIENQTEKKRIESIGWSVVLWLFVLIKNARCTLTHSGHTEIRSCRFAGGCMLLLPSFAVLLTHFSFTGSLCIQTNFRINILRSIWIGSCASSSSFSSSRSFIFYFIFFLLLRMSGFLAHIYVLCALVFSTPPFAGVFLR